MPQKFPLNFREESELEVAKPATNVPDVEGFVYVPAIGLYVQREKQLHGKNWTQTQEELGKQGRKPPTIEEIRQFLIYLKQNPNPENTQTYNEITQVRDPWR